MKYNRETLERLKLVTFNDDTDGSTIREYVETDDVAGWGDAAGR